MMCVCDAVMRIYVCQEKIVKDVGGSLCMYLEVGIIVCPDAEGGGGAFLKLEYLK